MEEKKSKGMYIVAGMLLFLAVLLLVLAGVFFLGEKKDKPGGSGNAGPFVQKESEGTSTAVQNDTEKYEDGVVFVLGGYKMVVPKKYSCTFAEGIGLIVYVDNAFQMKLMVKAEPFERVSADPESLVKKTLDAGGKIVQEIQEKELDGGKYLFFKAEINGSLSFVAHTGDSEKRFAAQIIIESEDMTDQELLQVFADIVKTAEKTEEPDSVKEDIFNQAVAPDYGTKKSESSRRDFIPSTHTETTPTGRSHSRQKTF